MTKNGIDIRYPLYNRINVKRTNKSVITSSPSSASLGHTRHPSHILTIPSPHLLPNIEATLGNLLRVLLVQREERTPLRHSSINAPSLERYISSTSTDLG